MVQKGRFDESKQILDKIARKNRKPTIEIAVLKRFALLDEAQETMLKRYTYLDLFKRWKYAKLSLATILAW